MSSSSSPGNYMYMFCGDSHVWQFKDYPGWDTLSLTRFLGATMKGLASDRGMLRHGQAIMTLATAPTPKTLFLMFGHVDLDVTWFRKSVLEGVDEEDFFRQRLDALTTFVKGCRRLAGGVVRRVCVILPQLPTLPDSHFNEVTAGLAGLEEHQLSELAAAQDCSQLARCHRTARFNEFISQNLSSDEDLAVYRIDDQMADGTGLVLPEFVRDDLPDTHPKSEATAPLWWDLLKDEVRQYRYMDEVRRQKLGQRSAVLQELDDVEL